MLETIFAKAALAKAAAVLSGLSIATTGAAAADLLPGATQNGVATVVEAVSPLDLPDRDDKRQDGEHRKDGDVADKPEDPSGQRNPNAEDNFGAYVSGQAPEAPRQDGRAFGQSVSNSAPKADAAVEAQKRRPATRPTASNNPGTSYRESARANRPATTPTASNNPGTSYRESAPTADSNPGSGYRR